MLDALQGQSINAVFVLYTAICEVVQGNRKGDVRSGCTVLEKQMEEEMKGATVLELCHLPPRILLNPVGYFGTQ